MEGWGWKGRVGRQLPGWGRAQGVGGGGVCREAGPALGSTVISEEQ